MVKENDRYLQMLHRRIKNLEFVVQELLMHLKYAPRNIDELHDLESRWNETEPHRNVDDFQS